MYCAACCHQCIGMKVKQKCPCDQMFPLGFCRALNTDGSSYPRVCVPFNFGLGGVASCGTFCHFVYIILYMFFLREFMVNCSSSFALCRLSLMISFVPHCCKVRLNWTLIRRAWTDRCSWQAPQFQSKWGNCGNSPNHQSMFFLKTWESRTITSKHSENFLCFS